MAEVEAPAHQLGQLQNVGDPEPPDLLRGAVLDQVVREVDVPRPVGDSQGDVELEVGLVGEVVHQVVAEVEVAEAVVEIQGPSFDRHQAVVGDAEPGQLCHVHFECQWVNVGDLVVVQEDVADVLEAFEGVSGQVGQVVVFQVQHAQFGQTLQVGKIKQSVVRHTDGSGLTVEAVVVREIRQTAPLVNNVKPCAIGGVALQTTAC